MKHTASYAIRIPNACAANGGLSRKDKQILEDTVTIYRSAVSFLIEVVQKHWSCLSLLKANNKAYGIERLIHATKKNPKPTYPEFDKRFYKMPSYLRRAAIVEACGTVSSYVSNLENWQETKQGKHPRLSFNHYSFPTLYKPNMFKWVEGEYVCRVKVFQDNDWRWLELPLKRSDVTYIANHCQEREISNPTLERRGKVWSLRFAFTCESELTQAKPQKQRIIAVDLGLNTHATCCVMESDGTVIGRKFIDFPIEKDRLSRALGRIKKAQQNGNYKTPRLWALANNINKGISQKVASAIIDIAVEYSCDVLVFEHLDTQGKIKGSKKQRLHLWRKREIQRICESQGHLYGMRISRVCAWNTSKLAFDGTGRVLRGRDIPEEYSSYNNQTCMFASGKFYNCDLNAAYNIGARYFIRELLKSLPEMERLAVQAKVPELAKRTTCTLSSLITLNAELSCDHAA